MSTNKDECMAYALAAGFALIEDITAADRQDERARRRMRRERRRVR